MEEDLTPTERTTAALQGWALERIYDTRGYWTQAVVPSPGSALKSPYEAHQFVWLKASELDDRLCRKAVRIVHKAEVAGRMSSTPRKKKK